MFAAVQVMKVCRDNRLHSAVAYILSRGLDDYVAPAVEMVMALAVADASPAGPAPHPAPQVTRTSCCGGAC